MDEGLGTLPAMSTLFNTSVRHIEEAYKILGHKLGWRFLYTPAETLSKPSSLVFLGLNPGGSKFEESQASCKKGNAYRCERWDKDERLNPLQLQVCTLFGMLAGAIGVERDLLMDRTLSGNLCPFRSSSFANLPNGEATMEFSRELWRTVLDEVKPTVIITMGNETTRQVNLLFDQAGTVKFEPTGWGGVTYRLASATVNGRTTLLIGLPHFSRFRIFGRASSSQFRPLLAAVKKHWA